MDNGILEDHLIAYHERKDREMQDIQIYDYRNLVLRTAFKFCSVLFDWQRWNPIAR